MSDNLVFNGNIIYLLPLVFYNMKFVIPLEFWIQVAQKKKGLIQTFLLQLRNLFLNVGPQFIWKICKRA